MIHNHFHVCDTYVFSVENLYIMILLTEKIYIMTLTEKLFPVYRTQIQYCKLEWKEVIKQSCARTIDVNSFMHLVVDILFY